MQFTNSDYGFEIFSRTNSLRNRLDSCSTGAERDAPAGDSTVPQQVTQHNWDSAIIDIRQALEDCHFVGLDCEFSGLSATDELREEKLDDFDERYRKLRENSSQLTVVQLGLSCFTWLPGQGYIAKTFNIWTFPRPCGEIDRRFTCQASSLLFLVANGLDFNRWVKDGVGYMPLHLRNSKLASLKNDLHRQQQQQQPHYHPAAPVVAAAATVAVAAPVPPMLGMRRSSSSGSIAAACGAEGSSADVSSEAAPTESCSNGGISHNVGIHAKAEGFTSAVGMSGPPSRRNSNNGNATVTSHLSPSANPWVNMSTAPLWQQVLEGKMQAIHAAAGASVLFELLRDSRKPAVVHNPALDLAYMLGQFVEPLPPSWEQYKDMVVSWFPGGVYDTKLLAKQLGSDWLNQPFYFPHTTLQNLFTCFPEPCPPLPAAAPAPPAPPAPPPAAATAAKAGQAPAPGEPQREAAAPDATSGADASATLATPAPATAAESCAASSPAAAAAAAAAAGSLSGSPPRPRAASAPTAGSSGAGGSSRSRRSSSTGGVGATTANLSVNPLAWLTPGPAHLVSHAVGHAEYVAATAEAFRAPWQLPYASSSSGVTAYGSCRSSACGAVPGAPAAELSAGPRPGAAAYDPAGGFSSSGGHAAAAAAGSDSKAHEAGFDAFMTGAVFARLLLLADARARAFAYQSAGGYGGAAAAASDPVSLTAAGPEAPSVDHFAPYVGKCHMSCSDLPHFNLNGSDPLPDRPSTLHISNLRPGTQWYDVFKACAAAGLGRVRVAMLPHHQAALAEVVGADLAPKALQKLKKDQPQWHVIKFAEYFAAKQQAARQQQQQQQQAASPQQPSRHQRRNSQRQQQQQQPQQQPMPRSNSYSSMADVQQGVPAVSTSVPAAAGQSLTNGRPASPSSSPTSSLSSSPLSSSLLSSLSSSPTRSLLSSPMLPVPGRGPQPAAPGAAAGRPPHPAASQPVPMPAASGSAAAVAAAASCSVGNSPGSSSIRKGWLQAVKGACPGRSQSPCG